MDEPNGLPEWALTVPQEIRDDPIWSVAAYRYALFLGDLAKDQLPAIRHDVRTRAHVDQLNAAVASVSANIAEGYSRSTGRERARFYEYAYGSAREARDWIFKIRCALDRATVAALLQLVTRIMKLLVVMIQRERGAARISNDTSRR